MKFLTVFLFAALVALVCFLVGKSSIFVLESFDLLDNQESESPDILLFLLESCKILTGVFLPFCCLPFGNQERTPTSLQHCSTFCFLENALIVCFPCIIILSSIWKVSFKVKLGGWIIALIDFGIKLPAFFHKISDVNILGKNGIFSLSKQSMFH